MTTFYNGDCLEVMKDLSDNSIDCFICDLPYGQLAGGNINKTLLRMDRSGVTGPRATTETGVLSGCPWDVKLDLKVFWEQVKRLAKNDHTPVLMFCNTKFGYDLIKSNESWFRYDLVWDKGHGVSFLSANKMPMKSHEMIYVFSKKGAFYRRVDIKGDFKASGGGRDTDKSIPNRQYGTQRGKVITDNQGKRCPLSVIPIRSKSAGGHPTEKPEELYEWLLKRYVPENGTILDPTAGSFNSCFVADRLGLTAIGIEKDNEFFEKAVKRLNP